MKVEKVVAYKVRNESELAILKHLAKKLPLTIKAVPEDTQKKTIFSGVETSLLMYHGSEGQAFIVTDRKGRLEIAVNEEIEGVEFQFVHLDANGDVRFYFKDDTWEGNVTIQELEAPWW